MLFVVYQIFKQGKQNYASRKAAVAAHGFDPKKINIRKALHAIVAETRAAAEDKFNMIQALPLQIDSLSLLSESLNFDFLAKGIDAQFSNGKSPVFLVCKPCGIVCYK